MDKYFVTPRIASQCDTHMRNSMIGRHVYKTPMQCAKIAAMWSKLTVHQELLNFPRSGTIAMDFNTVCVVTYDKARNVYVGSGLVPVRCLSETSLLAKIDETKDLFSEHIHYLTKGATKVALIVVESSTPVFEKGPYCGEPILRADEESEEVETNNYVGCTHAYTLSLKFVIDNVTRKPAPEYRIHDDTEHGVQVS